MVEGVLAVDSDERIITLNRAAAQLTDIPISEASGKKVCKQSCVMLIYAGCARSARQSGFYSADISIRASDRDRTIQAHGTALHGREGRAMAP